MTSALSTVAPKLEKLIPLLATDKTGEVVATAAAITRTLARAGLDLHDLAKVLGRAEPHGTLEPVAWGDLPLSEWAGWLAHMSASRLLSHWVQNFCTSILAQLRYRPRSTLSAKQIAVLGGEVR